MTVNALTFWVLPVGGNPKSGDSISAAPRSEPWSLREAWNEAERTDLVAITALDPAEVALRLRKGARCLALTTNKTPLATAWISTRPEWVSELPGWFAASPTNAYVWDCYTRPWARGQGLYATLLRRIADRISQQGVENLWLGIDWHNWPSIRGVTSAGFRPVGLAITNHAATGWSLRVLPAAGAAPRFIGWLTRSLVPSLRPEEQRSARPSRQDRQGLKRSAAGRGGLSAHRRSL